MKPETSATLLTLTLLLATPVLFEVGHRLGGLPAAVTLPSVAVLAALVFTRRGAGPKPPAPLGGA